MNFTADSIVKSCRKLESGLRLGQEGIHACQLGAFASPLYWTAEDASNLKITKEMIAEKRQHIFLMLNDDTSNTPCKHCKMVTEKRYGDINFTRLGHIDLAATTICNLRCSFCDYTKYNWFRVSNYDALAILRVFSPDDVEWDSAVDFNGGEPTLLSDFDDYICYFTSMRIRVFLYTNAVKFSQSVYDNLKKGSIRWVCSSLDCGTPSSFLRMKQKDYFIKVMENLTRYAHAGSQGGGNLAVKYIFCKDNCGDDDISGFAYAMLAIRPQKVWLTFDFLPLQHLPGDSSDFGGYDYSIHIAAYAKLFRLMERNSVVAEHFATRHLAVVGMHGKILLDKALSEIEESRRNDPPAPPEIELKDFRQKECSAPVQSTVFTTSPLRISMPGKEAQPWSIRGNRVLIAPACVAAIRLIADQEIEQANIVSFLDRDQVLNGKLIDGIPIHSYGEIKALNPDVILVAAPETHRADILRTLALHAGPDVNIALFEPQGTGKKG